MPKTMSMSRTLGVMKNGKLALMLNPHGVIFIIGKTADILFFVEQCQYVIHNAPAIPQANRILHSKTTVKSQDTGNVSPPRMNL